MKINKAISILILCSFMLTNNVYAGALRVQPQFADKNNKARFSKTLSSNVEMDLIELKSALEGIQTILAENKEIRAEKLRQLKKKAGDIKSTVERNRAHDSVYFADKFIKMKENLRLLSKYIAELDAIDDSKRNALIIGVTSGIANVNALYKELTDNSLSSNVSLHLSADTEVKKLMTFLRKVQTIVETIIDDYSSQIGSEDTTSESYANMLDIVNEVKEDGVNTALAPFAGKSPLVKIYNSTRPADEIFKNSFSAFKKQVEELRTADDKRIAVTKIYKSCIRLRQAIKALRYAPDMPLSVGKVEDVPRSALKLEGKPVANDLMLTLDKLGWIGYFDYLEFSKEKSADISFNFRLKTPAERERKIIAINGLALVAEGYDKEKMVKTLKGYFEKGDILVVVIGSKESEPGIKTSIAGISEDLGRDVGSVTLENMRAKRQWAILSKQEEGVMADKFIRFSNVDEIFNNADFIKEVAKGINAIASNETSQKPGNTAASTEKYRRQFLEDYSALVEAKIHSEDVKKAIKYFSKGNSPLIIAFDRKVYDAWEIVNSKPAEFKELVEKRLQSDTGTLEDDLYPIINIAVMILDAADILIMAIQDDLSVKAVLKRKSTGRVLLLNGEWISTENGGLLLTLDGLGWLTLKPADICWYQGTIFFNYHLKDINKRSEKIELIQSSLILDSQDTAGRLLNARGKTQVIIAKTGERKKLEAIPAVKERLKSKKAFIVELDKERPAYIQWQSIVDKNVEIFDLQNIQTISAMVEYIDLLREIRNAL